jgi:hypothetical protein
VLRRRWRGTSNRAASDRINAVLAAAAQLQLALRWLEEPTRTVSSSGVPSGAALHLISEWRTFLHGRRIGLVADDQEVGARGAVMWSFKSHSSSSERASAFSSSPLCLTLPLLHDVRANCRTPAEDQLGIVELEQRGIYVCLSP